MRTILLPLVFATAAGLGATGVANACSMPHISVFSLFDEAVTVMVGRVSSVVPPSGRTGGRAQLVANELLEGTSDRVRVPFGNTSCDVRFRRSREPLLVFLRADGRLVGNYQGHVRKPTPELLATLRAWSAAGAPDERVAVLLAAMAGPESRIAADAAAFVSEPRLRASVNESQLAALDAAALAHSANGRQPGGSMSIE